MSLQEYDALVVVEDYPRITGEKALMFVHTRNKYYKMNGFNVLVLNFRAKESYDFEGIRVISYIDFTKEFSSAKFNFLIAHAANIRHHLLFVKKYGCNFKHLVFFFHGHEVLPVNKVYPKPYKFDKQTKRYKKIIQAVYDTFKFKYWRKFIKKYKEKSSFIFVSHWMHDQFQRWVHADIDNHYYIIYNAIDSSFEKNRYEFKPNYKYDCITIRGNLDGAKYCMDIVNDIANRNPEAAFLVIGRGKFFSYYSKAKNITWIDKWLSHDEIIEYLEQAKCALMPTKTDAQGLMMCEFASYGIPLISSNIEVCREVLEGFDNVELISNDTHDLDLKKFYCNINQKPKRNSKFFQENTVARELELYKRLLSEK